ncbi:MAG TPA: PadR family transcriptional regulator [Alphaproteobacteria bacterium]|nr:PadR family transcriptional regulator [Alphaproteobacteria bacterium]
MTEKPLGVLQGTLELLVLKTLSGGAELHGFAILEWIRASTDEDLVVEDGALYHALHRMLERGWVTSSWGVSEKGRRARYYSLTGAGARALEDEEARWARYVEAVSKIAPGPSPA